MQFGQVAEAATVENLIDTIHTFPTFSEALKRAVQAFVWDISVMSCCVE